MENIGQNKKNIGTIKISKMENNKFKNDCIKNCTCYYLDNRIKSEYFDILLDEKSYKNILTFRTKI